MTALAVPARLRYVPHPPDTNLELAEAAIELAADCDMILDPWQEEEIRAGLAFGPDGKWVCGEVGSCVPRQNGKNGITEVRQLAGLFLVQDFPVLRSRDPLAVHTAHLNDTAAESFRRLENLIEGNDELARRVKRYSRANGKEAIEVKGGERIRYRARTKGGGRGYGGDDLYLDEAMFLPEFGYGALRPILSARPNPQIWYTGSAVDQEIHEDGIVFARVRERALGSGEARLAYFEYSLDYDTPADVPTEALTDPDNWAQANPALGIRIMPETVEEERRAMADRSFIVERLGVGDWPDTDKTRHVIDPALWASLKDAESEALDPVCFAAAVASDRSKAAIAVAGKRRDGLMHCEIVDRSPGTAWVLPRLQDLTGRHHCLTPLCDELAASLLPEFEQAGIKVERTTATDMANACGYFYDAVDARRLRHLGTSELTSALKGAVQRPLGDAWAWHRRKSAVDITTLVAATLAVWGASKQRERVPMIGLISR